MKNYKTGDVPVVKGDKLSLYLCPKNDLEKDSMKDVPYPSLFPLHFCLQNVNFI